MWFRFSLICSFLLLLPGPVAAQDRAVLLLHSEPAPTAWTRDVAAGLAAGLASGTGVREVFLRTRSMDEDAFDEVFDRLSRELVGTAPAAVVANGETAFAFARKYGEDLFPAAPVIYCAMERPDPGVLADNCTGVPMALAPKASVDLIFSLRPSTRLVVAVADGSPATAPLMDAVRVAMVPYMDRAQLMFPGFETGNDDGLDTVALGETLSSVPTSAVVLFLGFAEDRDGEPVDEATVAALFRDRGVSPIFVLRDAWPDSGVGGWMVSGRDAGRDAARLVEALRRGEPAREMLPEPTRPALRLDGTALARFNLKAPPGAEIFNPPAQTVAEDPVLPITGLAWGFGLGAFAALLYALRRYKA